MSRSCDVVSHLRDQHGVRGALFGADYNPEQWPREVHAEDLELMARARVDFVTVGVFSWARLEPEPGCFDVAWLDQVLDDLHARGIAVDLAIPVASPPPWLGVLDPESLPQTRSGNTLWWGSRNQFNPSSPAYREAARRITGMLVERYAEHPAVVMWHVGNEYGQLSHDESTARAFRTWLRERYGDIDALNQAWGTTVWSMGLREFDDVIPPRETPYLLNPALALDFARFASDQLLDCYLDLAGIIRETVPDACVTTNFMGFFPLVDYGRWSEHVDVLADDHYTDPADPGSGLTASLTHSYLRTLGRGRPWVLMEQAAGAVNWRAHNVPKTSAQNRLETWRAHAHGADVISYFQFRQAASGPETFHSALVPHAGAETTRFEAVAELGRELDDSPLADIDPGISRVFFVHDWESWRATDGGGHVTSALDPIAQNEAYYRPFFRAGERVDIGPSTLLDAGEEAGAAEADGEERATGTLCSRYDLVVLPSQFLTRAELTPALEQFVHDGGQLLIGPHSGVVDQDVRAHLGGSGGGLLELAGVFREEPWPLAAPIIVRDETGEEAEVSRFVEVLRTTTARPLWSVAEGSLRGRPVITHRKLGAGAVWYVGCLLEPETLQSVIGRAAAAAGLELINLPEQVEVIRRGEAVVVLNHGYSPARLTMAGEDLDVPGEDMMIWRSA
ncbi:beta-galactosidase [Brachybacterium paraconglomeratum]|uniref:beta-galactosidase n=1 Tax=Brachybacterium paraconglomeratum TaxID=173362 RepID=UPI0031F148E2